MNKPTKFELMRKNRSAWIAKQAERNYLQSLHLKERMREDLFRRVANAQNVGLGGLAQGIHP